LQDTEQTLDFSIPEIRVPDYSVVLQSALNGRGVALGYVTSCGHLLREGLLSPALSRTLRTGKNYCMVVNPRSPNVHLAEMISQWIRDRAQNIISDVSFLLPPEHIVEMPQVSHDADANRRKLT
jgi:DNA-binding transcriptional LysR family regulator